MRKGESYERRYFKTEQRSDDIPRKIVMPVPVCAQDHQGEPRQR